MAQSVPSRLPQPGDFLVVVHDFDARGEDELTLRRGEKIELVELDDGFGDGWYLGRHTVTGQTGLFPAVYTAITPKLGVRKPETASSSADSDTIGPEDSSKPGALEDDVGATIEGKGEATPQASRRASASQLQDSRPDSEGEACSPLHTQSRRSSSSSLPSTPPFSSNIQRFRDPFGSHLKGGDSPVMNETLSVIDEHITDLSPPRHSIATQDQRTFTDSGSEYSSHIDHRISYIHGHETDEEEENQPTEEQVRKWDHIETARQLRLLGVEAKHCDIFQEQEITGDVLLEMDQEFLFMKEFDFGVMGRRLKTWHKIKAFQEQVKGFRHRPRGSVSTYYSSEEHERTVSRAGHAGPLLPRIPSLSEKPSSPYQSPRRVPSTSVLPSRRRSSLLHGSPGSPSTVSTYGGRELSARPSAASIRELNHSRRHSSIDTTNRSPPALPTKSSSVHQKKGSFDRGWTMSAGAQALASRPGTGVDVTDEDMILQQRFLEQTDFSDNSLNMADHLDALDRGYFSGGEVESRRTRKVLKKRDSFAGSHHSRQSSYAGDQIRSTSGNQRHFRFGSTDSSREPSGTYVSAAAKTYHGGSLKGRASGSGSHKIVTNLEDKPSEGPSFFSPFVRRGDSRGSETTGRSSPLPFQQIKNVAPKFRRAVGLRTASDGVSEKEFTTTSPVKEFSLPSGRTGSTTPSATSKSSERHSTDGSGKATEGALSLSRQRAPSKVGSKSKKDTSAYMRGLEKKTPQEQMEGCDYCGWMKKRSANLMTTWKPRLFVLRGRRLSYYYSEDDTEERGLIDITGHRVLRADQDPIVALHATITGARATPTSPVTSNGDATPPDIARSPAEASGSAKTASQSPFIFKLVPPKSGMSRSVQFTKPTTYYFQVDNVKEGRLWMAALMKATIERDLSRPVETTNKQKTISLKQARAMNQRPPALADANADEDDSGLKIQGLSLDKAASSAEPDAERSSLANDIGGVEPAPTASLPESLAESIS
ncbi:hypothetical protein VTN77DRAFT_629 [Rasamsonia byssochlamydoides]|uniref:uncharacterized protein n=1 Tax=Rasamsonia byssochlamydoides TaxID=89139 RepID=UPI0037445A86